MDILEILQSMSGNSSALKQLNKKVDAEPEKVEKAVQISIPMLMEALNRNTNNPQGAQSLAKALDQHQNDNVDNLEKFLQNVDMADGSKILEHIFSNKNQTVQNSLSKTTGLQQDQIGSILASLAPMLLGFLGNQKKAQNLDADGISNLTSSLSQNLQKNTGGNLFSLATKLLDANKDGSIIDDVLKMFGKFKKR
ncbi:MAG: DUF937 domain-containing protein [Atribacterota bacterium]|nr:DUF937 domain-containing protein [Atribacterota bacterium]